MRPEETETARRSAAERWQRAGAIAAVAAALLLLGLRGFVSPDVVFLTGGGWITNARAVDAQVQGYGTTHVPVARFVRRFELARAPAAAVLEVEAARAHRVLVNEAEMWRSPDPDPAWRSGRSGDVAAALRAGANEIAIEVWNPRGPPLLRARLGGVDAPLATDGRWTAAIDGGAAGAAVVPDDTRLHPSHAAGPSAARSLRKQGALVAGIFAAAALATALASGWLARHRARLPFAALVLVHALWIALFVSKGLALPVTTGFDARHHLAYVEWLVRERALPLPSDGWSMYQPPLYYALVAAAQQIGGAASAVATKLPSLAAGLGIVWATFGLARVVLVRPEAVAAAIVFAGVLPLNAVAASFVSNEPLHAALFGLATWLGARALAAPRTRLADAALVGAAVGLALLAKVTALVLAAMAGCFLVARAAQRDGPSLRLLAVAAAYLLPIAAIAGWFYARNVTLYGSPVVGNWNVPGMGWWSQPGFHTPDYYLGFGESLRRPILSGFHSFADAMYSSFWGDGWIAGRASAAFPTETWRWELVTLGYWVALPATAAIAFGVLRMLGLAFAPHECGRRAAWSFLLATFAALWVALLALTLDLPYFGQAKAPYLLGAVPIAAIAFVLGADAFDRVLALRVGPAGARALRAWWIGSALLLWLSLAS